uniref:Uncharacterized protein n=1 Tax=Manihot esculenta TaxID=3983 RepID=A0A2C9V3E4_MANES
MHLLSLSSRLVISPPLNLKHNFNLTSCYKSLHQSSFISPPLKSVTQLQSHVSLSQVPSLKLTNHQLIFFCKLHLTKF